MGAPSRAHSSIMYARVTHALYVVTIATVITVVLILCSAPAARADVVRAFNLVKLQRSAAAVLHGRCLSAREISEGVSVPYTEYEFEVLEAVKGCRGKNGKVLETITVRHAGTTKPWLREDGIRVLPLDFGVPQYQVGEEFVLFLTRESRLGLCSPVGLQQGKFLVTRDRRDSNVSHRGHERLLRGVRVEHVRSPAHDLLKRARALRRSMPLGRFLKLCQAVKK